MKNITLPKPLLTCLALLLFSGAIASDNPLVGTWTNLNKSTRSCPKFEISVNENGEAEFVWWGKTHPEDSRYGPFPLEIERNGKSAKAEHITSFSEMEFNLKLRGGEITLEISTEYTDDSGRNDYTLEETFEKKNQP